MAEFDDLKFKRGSSPAEALVEWHKSLESDTGGRAELRRVIEPSGAVFIPSFHRLRRAIERAAPSVDMANRLDRLSAIACTVARVRDDMESRNLGSLLASFKEGSVRPRVSEFRFRRLLEAKGNADLARQFRRIVAMLDERVDIVALANTIYWWRSDRTRQSLAYDYFRAAPVGGGEPNSQQAAKGARA
jgi:CRISPR system Cascade subunit CasB